MNRDNDDIIECINRRFDEILIKDCVENVYKMRCCIACDEIVKPGECVRITLKDLEQNRSLLQDSNWNSVSSIAKESYAIKSSDIEVQAVVFGLLLSPRASQLINERASDSNVRKAFTGCRRCKYHLSRNQMPPYAIANNYSLGTAPDCLTELNQVELALLTPVKTYGYCFSYTGGAQKQLQGSLSYYKVKIESITRAVQSFKVSGLTDNIVVMYYGSMTSGQKQRARKLHSVRTGRVLRALEWLLLYNEQWKRYDINLDEVRRSLRQPVVLDDSHVVQNTYTNTHSNIEDTDCFQIFFPDGTMSSLSGGQKSREEFTQLVANATENGYDIELKADLLRTSVNDYQDENLVNACLLQYPFGRGGLHEQRMKSDGSFTTSTDIKDYAQHICKLSHPIYHQELFVLILYNIIAKQNMLRTATLRTRSKINRSGLASELTASDVHEAINRKRVGQLPNVNSNFGHTYLSAIDAASRAVAHTNEAAKSALRKAESMQHKFGLSSYFMTFAPDDDNNFLLQVFSHNIINDDASAIHTLSDSELRERAKLRTEIRLRHPGLCAHMFELMLDIVIEEVIGWDITTGKAKSEGGCFGEPLAYLVGIEEQGRRSLHAHIQIWIKGFDIIREDVFAPRTTRVQHAAKKN